MLRGELKTPGWNENTRVENFDKHEFMFLHFVHSISWDFPVDKILIPNNIAWPYEPNKTIFYKHLKCLIYNPLLYVVEIVWLYELRKWKTRFFELKCLLYNQFAFRTYEDPPLGNIRFLFWTSNLVEISPSHVLSNDGPRSTLTKIVVNNISNQMKDYSALKLKNQ